jgi:hypothetical protein
MKHCTRSHRLTEKDTTATSTRMHHLKDIENCEEAQPSRRLAVRQSSGRCKEGAPVALR